uniref:GKAP1 n=1 Tax=Syphacia muris TaxID=451379 RepID=A0A0N5ASN1_9BILA
MPIAEQSKFACLKVEDDTSSDEERSVKFGKVKGNAGLKSTKKGSGSLIVHVVPQKAKNKGKKGKKAPQVVDETGLIIQDLNVDAAEMKYREELRQALKESYEASLKTVQNSNPEAKLSTAPDTAAAKVEKSEDCEKVEASNKSPVESLLKELDKKAKEVAAEVGSDGLSKSVGRAVLVYRKKLMDILEENSRLTEKLVQTQNNVDKYRSRCIKLCEILKDVELNEKADLIVQLEKAHQVETELGNQVGTLRGELMQATSKNREYEAKIKELSKR